MFANSSAEIKILFSIIRSKLTIKIRKRRKKHTVLICLKLVGFGPVLEPPTSKIANNIIRARKKPSPKETIFLFIANLYEASFNRTLLETKLISKIIQIISNKKRISKKILGEEIQRSFSGCSIFLIY